METQTCQEKRLNGLPKDFLPKPYFSPENPYWVDPAKHWGQFHPSVRPRNSARDFLYASAWELYRWDPHGAYLVRQATIRTVRVYWYIELHNSIKKCLAT